MRIRAALQAQIDHFAPRIDSLPTAQPLLALSLNLRRNFGAYHVGQQADSNSDSDGRSEAEHIHVLSMRLRDVTASTHDNRYGTA